MNIRTSSWILLAGLASAAPARAQLIDLQVSASHRAYAEGQPQTFTTTALQSNGMPSAFGGGAQVSAYALTGVYSGGAPANLVVLRLPQTIQNFLLSEPRVGLVPADPGHSGSLRLSVADIRSVRDGVAEKSGEADLFGGCRSPRLFNDRAGLPVDATFHPCDAVDASLRLNGVSFLLSAAEDRVAMSLKIPEVGYAFTSNVTQVAPDGFVRRRASLQAVKDDFFASGKAPLVVARLLGKPDGFTLARGVLPTGGSLIVGELTVAGKTQRIAADSPGELLAYAIANRGATYSDFGLPEPGGCYRTTAGGPVTGLCADARARLSIAGIEVTAAASPNTPDISFAAPDLNLTFTSKGALDGNDALGQFLGYALDNADRKALSRAYSRYLAQADATNPLVGNPVSAQGQLNRATLDLDTPSDSLNEKQDSGGGGSAGRARSEDPSGWMVGGRTGYLRASGQDAAFADTTLERSFRFREGSRDRLKLSVPLSYIRYSGAGGGDTATAGVRAAYEHTLIDGTWVVEPSAGVSGFYSSGAVTSGALYAVGVSTRYKIAPVGRGHLVLGSAVNYSSTLKIEAGDFASPKIANTAVRNGVAYQLPVGRFLGRQGTLRSSYTYTHLFGDKVAVQDFHEVSVSYGVASREASVRQVGEVLRLGASGSFGRGFLAISGNLGYRF